MSASVSVVTAAGRGAIAVVRVWGEGTLAAVDAVFRPARGGGGLASTAPGRLRVGRIGAGLGDEVVAVVIEGDLPEVEVQCHGGPAPVAMVVGALTAAGARLRGPRAWAGHSAGSPLRAEADLALAHAPTLRAAEILLDQAAGALDEDLRRAMVADSAEGIAILDALLDRAGVGIRLVEGWRVVLAGRPNVGKSRLLNALAGYERAIVDPTPGTTRDVVTVPAAFDGWPVELADTAGLRESDEPIEAKGVALARLRQREADLVLVVLDRSEPLNELDLAVMAGHPEALRVANKSDLPAAWDGPGLGAQTISAERGDGVAELVAAIAARLVPDVPPPGSGVPFRTVHARRIAAIRDRLAAGDRARAVGSLARWVAR